MGIVVFRVKLIWLEEAKEVYCGDLVGFCVE